MRRRKLKKWLLGGASVLLLWPVTHVCATLYAGLSDELGQADVAVVLGNKVEPDGSPSLCLKSRLDKALELYRKGYTQRVIVSGSRGSEGYDEAEAMRRYLAAKGIPAQHIIVDSDGSNTWWTARNTRRILREHGWQSAIVISNYYHISRCKLAFANFHIPKTFTAHADLTSVGDPFAIVREFAAFYYYLLRSYPND